MGRTAYLGARVLRAVARRLERFSHAERTAIASSIVRHDMEGDADDRYYGRQYWHWMMPALGRAPTRARILDLGCAQGRLSLPAAAMFLEGSVVGVDFAGGAIERARQNAAARGLSNVEFFSADALAFARGLESESFDVVVMTELSFYMRSFGELIAEGVRVLRSGGLFCASFRSQYFNLLRSVRDRDWNAAWMCLDAREGEWLGGVVWFTWQTPSEVRDILQSRGLKVESLRGIGVVSGMENDPLAAVARPSMLGEADRESLLAIETAAANDYAACGRYILAIASKPSPEGTS